MRRKLSFYAAFMAAGMFTVQSADNKWIGVTLISAVILAYITTEYLHKSVKYRNTILLFFFAGIIVASFYTFFFYNGKISDNLNQSVTETARIYKIEKKDDCSYRLYADLENDIISEKILIRYYKEIPKWFNLLDSEIEFTGELCEPETAGNPNTFDYRNYLKSKGVRYVMTVDHFFIVREPKSILSSIKRKILYERELFIEKLSLSEENKALVKGILFGDTSGIEETIYDDFRKNSTSHVLAVSGLHIGILYGIYELLRKKTKNNIIVIAFISMLLIYGSACMWSVSVTRAISLVVLKVVGDLTERRYDIISALAFIAIIQMLNNPFVLFSVSFQMSYLAVLLITFTGSALERFFKGYSGIIGVQLGFMPYMAYTFNYVTFTGIISNIPVVFLISLIVPLGIALFLMFLLFGITFENAESAMDALINMSVFINHLIGEKGWLSFELPSPPKWKVAGFYVILFTLCSESFRITVLRKKVAQLFLCLTLVMLIAFSAFGNSDQFRKCELVMVDVGQGDCMHLRYGGHNFLFDGGGKSDYDVGDNILKPYLLKNGCGRIDAAFVTHKHTDHYKGIEELTKVYEVTAVSDNLTKGRVVNLGKDAKVEILWPRSFSADTEDENKNSIVYMIYIKEIKILITGDITEEGEKMLLEEYENTDILHADILKVAHHGSKYSSSEEFLKAVRPKIALIGVGKHNNYGHPAQETMNRLKQNNITTYRTDIYGAIGIKIKGNNLQIITKK